MTDQDQETASKLVAALQKMVPSASEAGLTETSRILTEAIGVIGFEASGFRIPRCTNCTMPRSDNEQVQRINRDRVVPGG